MKLRNRKQRIAYGRRIIKCVAGKPLKPGQYPSHGGECSPTHGRFSHRCNCKDRIRAFNLAEMLLPSFRP
jgi:hypothetical protein